ncbi:MAG: ribonuclease E inhibitor RraB [Fimbriimonadales bacterium]|nr:ribonuclease E inhibitor RraB [Fimbriimonadales bacterium]MDW8051679.1 ribonuclease E inhibitor RraB [Armatimonadota bacterium]
MRHEDMLALRQVLSAGISPDTVCSFEYFLYFGDEALAHLAAQAVQQAGYYAEVEPTGEGGWQLVVFAEHRPDINELERRVNFLEQIAEAFGGEYDGWGVPLG